MKMESRKISGATAAARILAILAALCAFLPDGALAASVKCGTVEELTRTAMVRRDGGETELALGDEVYSFDSIRTGELGYAVIKFVDDTLMAVGSNSAVTITEVQFVPKSSMLHLGIDRGAIWISLGSIGLVDPNAVKLTTPKTLVSSGNATLQFDVGSEETVKVQWIPNGGRVSVYGVKTRELKEIREADSVIYVSSSGELSEKAPVDEVPQDAGDEGTAEDTAAE
jgi:hypothetical protein